MYFMLCAIVNIVVLKYYLHLRVYITLLLQVLRELLLTHTFALIDTALVINQFLVSLLDGVLCGINDALIASD